jgi:site-specific recombinase XerC
VQPVHVAAYVEALQRLRATPSVKQQLAALRMLFDWLVVGQVIPNNPSSSVRGPKHSVKKGKTPVLAADEARALLKSAMEKLVGKGGDYEKNDVTNNGSYCRTYCWISIEYLTPIL